MATVIEGPIFKKIDALPPLRRGGSRSNPMREKYIEALKTLDILVLEGIEDQKAYSATQQRIRTAAHSAGMNVTIRQGHREDGLFDLVFQGIEKEPEDEVEVEDTPQPKAQPKAQGKKTTAKS